MRKYCLGLLFFGGLSLIALAGGSTVESLPFPVPLDAYGDAGLIKSGDIIAVLINRIGHTPFNLWASLIFLFAILHTFFAAKIMVIAHKLEQQHAEKMRAEGKSEEEIEHNPLSSQRYFIFLERLKLFSGFGFWFLLQQLFHFMTGILLRIISHTRLISPNLCLWW